MRALISALTVMALVAAPVYAAEQTGVKNQPATNSPAAGNVPAAGQQYQQKEKPTDKLTDKEIEARRAELATWEAKLKKDEERISAMRRDLDDQLDKYTKLLMKIELALNQAGDVNDKNFKKIIKTFEAMQAEESSARIAALPESSAVKILLGMNPKKAGAALALMAPDKVASLTERMEAVLKNLPKTKKK